MKTTFLALLIGLPRLAFAEGPAITIYNQGFGVVRDSVPLDLKGGVNHVRFAEATVHVEADSVILRDPKGAVKLQILEQNYRNDPISEGLLLFLNEGQTIPFLVKETNKPDHEVMGKIIRSGYMPHSAEAMQRYGQRYYQSQMAMAYGSGGMSQPVIEVEGQIQFTLPGQPRFPKLGDDTILKPTLEWQIQTEQPAKLNAELCYVTGGMSWDADYNVVAPEKGDQLDFSGWVTMDNQTGKTFPEARIKLMAGDVHKLQPDDGSGRNRAAMGSFAMADAAATPVKEKTFDEYHLYTLNNPTTLRDRETKQVEFVRSAGVQSERIYVYDGVFVDANRRGYNMENIRFEESYGTQSNPKVWVMREFKNSQANHLGMPLPGGRVRFYRQDDDGQLVFVGENLLDHTPKDELLRIYTGNAFDLVGQRKRTNYKSDRSNHWVDETFEIAVRNHKKEPAEIRIVEHLYRGTNWSIRDNSNTFLKTDAQTMEFRIPLKPDEEHVTTYTVHYTW